MNHSKLIRTLGVLVLGAALLASCNDEGYPFFAKAPANPNPNPGANPTPTPTPTPVPLKNCQVTYNVSATFSGNPKNYSLNGTFYFDSNENSLQVQSSDCPFVTVESFQNFDFAIGHYIGPAPVTFPGWTQTSTGGPVEQPAGDLDVFGISFRGTILYGEMLSASTEQVSFNAAYPEHSVPPEGACRFSSTVSDGLMQVHSGTGTQTTYTLSASATVFYAHDEDISQCVDVVERHLSE